MAYQVEVDGDEVDVRDDVISVDGSFDVDVVNRGSPAHVHVTVSDSLAPYTGLRDNNVYVEEEASVEVLVGPVETEVEGYLDVTVNYGAVSERVPVVLEASEPPTSSVDVDESLDQPAVEDAEPRVDLLVAGVVGVAVLSLVVFAALVGEWTLALVVSVIALFGVAIMWIFKNYDELTEPAQPEEEEEAGDD